MDLFELQIVDNTSFAFKIIWFI